MVVAEPDGFRGSGNYCGGNYDKIGAEEFDVRGGGGNGVGVGVGVEGEVQTTNNFETDTYWKSERVPNSHYILQIQITTF